jgi:hypothetical protein
MTYAPSKEQFEMELFRWKADHDVRESQYMTQGGGIVTVRNVDANRLGLSTAGAAWQEGAKQIVVGLIAQQTLYKALQFKLTSILGQTPGQDAIIGWATQYRQMYSRRKGVHAVF